MSKAITVNIPHELGRAEARRRIEEGFARFSSQMGAAAGAFTKSWDGDRLSFSLQAMGQAISGAIDVQDTSVRLEVLLPNLLALVANKLKGRLQKEGQILLEKK
ncbi:polyhydroxyalkanoic acid system family protein [Phenylobacterium sp.]|uniref:polyhydroxyalkanoic acid system family protein n=1 Tax=Phenylobacterium sp. TaxID=1871053 RepID=UPI0035AE2DEC